MAETPLGRLCWYELMTTEPEKAPDFYGAIAGWGTGDFEVPGGPPYTLWMNGDQAIGGLLQLPEDAVAGGAPPHWLVHISTPDLAATTAKARELGGAVLMNMTMPSVGSFSIIRDPQGAVFSAFQPEDGAPGHDGLPEIGEFSWNELMTDGWEDAWSFYSQLFGWQKTGTMDMGDMGIYQMYGRGAHPIGGIMNRPPEMPMSAWLFYIHVPDVDAALEKVRKLGGEVTYGPMEVPGGDMVAACSDPEGAAFAVHALAKS